MGKADYTRDQLVAGIAAAGVKSGDVVSLQASLGRLGMPREVSSYPEISNFVIDAFLNVLGPTGTLIVPTYTYSIGRDEVFDVGTTPSGVGEFTEIFRKRPGVMRSRDPMLSTAGLGPKANQILRDISNSCYGPGSVFHRLREANAKICTLGISLYWATFRHHIEELASVPFRFKKLFSGLVREGGVTRRETWIYFAAPLIENCEPVGLPLEKAAREHGLVGVSRIGRGSIMCIEANRYFDFGLQQLTANPWLTAKGPALDLHELVRKEDERVGGKKWRARPLRNNASVTEMIDTVWDMPRDLVSDGYDAALRGLATQIPMTIHEYPVGKECWSWIIPEKWTCREAYLETMDGRRLFSYQDHPLHVPSYSHPFKGVVSREELLAHLHVHPVLPDAVPYHYLFYRREWGLCCSRRMKESLNDPQYRVVIDAAFSFGTLKAGEAVVQGASDDCIVICGQLDHPMQVNDGLSGCAAGVAVLRELSKRRDLKHSYRLLLVPETIGSIAWLSDHEDLIPRMRGGIFLEMVGLDNPIIMQHSFDPDGAFDRCCLSVLRSREPGFRTGKILEVVTNDDRQFNAPGVRVPMVSLSRVTRPCGRDGTWLYDQYHSAEDTPELAVEARLEDTVAAVLEIVDAWEKNYVPRPRFKGEPFLSRAGIFYDYSVDANYGQALFEFVQALDGHRSLVDIALEASRPFHTIHHIAEQFRLAGLVD